MENRSSLKYSVLAALFASLTAVGSYIAIPVGPVPVVIANLFVLLAGLLLRPRWAASSMGIFLFIGAIGIPVFSGGKSGLAALLGPTGGFLFGYLSAAFMVSVICRIGKKSLISDIAAVAAGIAVIYMLGVPWLKYNLGFDWGKALGIGMIPFIPGDILKGAAAVFVARNIRPQIEE